MICLTLYDKQKYGWCHKQKSAAEKDEILGRGTFFSTQQHQMKETKVIFNYFWYGKWNMKKKLQLSFGKLFQENSPPPKKKKGYFIRCKC